MAKTTIEPRIVESKSPILAEVARAHGINAEKGKLINAMDGALGSDGKPLSGRSKYETRMQALREAAAKAAEGTTVGIRLPWRQVVGSRSWAIRYGFLPGGTPLPVKEPEAPKA